MIHSIVGPCNMCCIRGCSVVSVRRQVDVSIPLCILCTCVCVCVDVCMLDKALLCHCHFCVACKAYCISLITNLIYHTLRLLLDIIFRSNSNVVHRK